MRVNTSPREQVRYLTYGYGNDKYPMLKSLARYDNEKIFGNSAIEIHCSVDLELSTSNLKISTSAELGDSNWLWFWPRNWNNANNFAIKSDSGRPRTVVVWYSQIIGTHWFTWAGDLQLHTSSVRGGSFCRASPPVNASVAKRLPRVWVIRGHLAAEVRRNVKTF